MAISNWKIAAIASGVVFGMLGLAFASKPLYDTFCRVTGFGGTTRVAEKAPTQIIDREIEIRFDSNVIDIPLQFRPSKTSLPVRLGEHAIAFYEVTNTSDEPVSAIASYNVTPHKAGPFFNKIECFCFEEQWYQPGETYKLPVIYFVDPYMDEERNMKDVSTITLSYTFVPTADFKGAAKSASLTTAIASE